MLKMKKLILILLITIPLIGVSQWTGTDSLRNYNNRFIDNNASKAFTNLRLHNLLAGIIDFLDSASGGSSIALGIDTMFMMNDSTFVYKKNGVFRQFTIRGVQGAGDLGEVPFSNGFGKFSNDSNFTYDISQGADAGRLIVGPVTINGGGLAKINSTSDNMNALALSSFGTGMNTILFRRARGSIGAPTALQQGDDLFNLSGRGYSGTGFTTSGAVSIYARTTQDWTDTTKGTRFVISMTARDSSTGKESFVIEDDERIYLPRYPSLDQATDTNNIKPLAINLSTGQLIPFFAWPGAGGSGGLNYEFSPSQPTGTDTSKIWIKTPAIAGVYDVYSFVTATFAWQRLGWLSIDGILTSKRPVTIVGAGQSNAGGIGPGGDTSFMSGIIAYTSGSANAGIDDPTHWEQARIGKSPFFSTNNNIGFQIAKQLKKNGDADIVRVVETYQGGVGLGAWISSGGHYLLDTLRQRLQRSGIDTIDVFAWHHGESGGVTGQTLGGYVVDQRTFYDSLCDPATTGFIRNYTRYIAGGLGTADSRNYNTIFNIGSPEGGQRTLNWDGNLVTAWVPSWELTDIGDGVHLTGTSLDSLGQRYYTEYKKLPHNLWDENPPATWNLTYDLRESYVSRLVNYNGSDVQYQDHTGIQFGYKASGGNTVYFGNDNSVNIGSVSSLPGTNTASNLRIYGRLSLAEANSNSVIATNFNPNLGGGSFQHNTIFGNYTSNWTANGGIDNVLIGNDAGYYSGRMPNNTVAIGFHAGDNFTPNGTGDYNTIIGANAGVSGLGSFNTIVGGQAGQNIYTNEATIIGYQAGGTSVASYTAIGYKAIADSNSQVVLGDTNVSQLKVGKIRFKINTTPISGDVYKFNTVTSVFEPGLLNNFANSDLNFTGDRTHNGKGHSFLLDSASQIAMSAKSLNLSSLNARGGFSFSPQASAFIIYSTTKGSSGTDSLNVNINTLTNENLSLNVANPAGRSSNVSMFSAGSSGRSSVFIKADSVNVRAPIKVTDSLYMVGDFSASDETNSIKKASYKDLRGYKQYTAIIDQTGTSAPIATVLGRNEIGSIVWSRVTVGTYSGTLSGAFTGSKTFALSGIGNEDAVQPARGGIFRLDDNTVWLTVRAPDGTLTDDWAELSVEIRVYP